MSKSTQLRMYKILDDDNASYLDFSFRDCKVYYREKGTSDWQILSVSRNGSATENIYTIDEESGWNPETCEIKIIQEFSLHNLRELFKSRENNSPLMPVALEDDTLAIAAVWWSDKSCLRGCDYISDVLYTDVKGVNESHFTFEKDFDAGYLAGQLEVSYKLYLKEPGGEFSPGFAHRPGVILGNIGTSFLLQIDGEGAKFPVSTINSLGEPLWWTEMKIDDPFEDTFTEEYFCLVLNEAHPDYKELRKKSGNFTALYYEVFASALEELFLVLRRDFAAEFDAADLNDIVPGTVAFAVLYMVKTFDIQMDNDITGLHKSIRRAVYQQLKGAVKG